MMTVTIVAENTHTSYTMNQGTLNTHRSSTCRRLVLLVYYLYCANAPGELQYSVHGGFRVITSSLPSCIPNVGIAPHPMIMMLYGSFHSLLLLAASGESSVHKPRRTCVGVLTVRR